MSKKTVDTGYHVLVEPRRLGDFGGISVSDSMIVRDAAQRLKEYKERCVEIATQIKRHVENVGYVVVEAETKSICEHCGNSWTEDSDEYNGGCCEKDQATQDVKKRTK